MEHKLEIEFIHQEKGRFNLFKNKEIIQTKPFKIGFSFKNIGDTPLLGALVNNIRWGSASGQNIFAQVDKSFHLDTINPGDKIEVWVEKVGTYMFGLCNVSFSIIPDIVSDTIKTFQVDPFTRLVTPSPHVNQWIDFFFVRSKNEYEQSIGNTLLLVVAFLTFLVALLNLIWFFRFQVQPMIDTQERNVADAKEYCSNNPQGVWPRANGGTFTCDEVLTMLNFSTTSAK